jgi:hypothetical protein
VSLRIALLRVQRLLADVVRSAFSDDDVEFDDIGTAAEVITNAAATLLHNVVIAGVQDPWQDDVVNLKRSHPGLVVLGLGGDGRVTWLYELVPWPHVLGALGPAELRSTVFAAVHATTTT